MVKLSGTKDITKKKKKERKHIGKGHILTANSTGMQREGDI